MHIKSVTSLFTSLSTSRKIILPHQFPYWLPRTWHARPMLARNIYRCMRLQGRILVYSDHGLGSQETSMKLYIISDYHLKHVYYKHGNTIAALVPGDASEEIDCQSVLGQYLLHAWYIQHNLCLIATIHYAFITQNIYLWYIRNLKYLLMVSTIYSLSVRYRW